MSRYEIESQKKKYVVGWDHPLQTFFLQVHDLTLPEDEQVVVSLGSTVETEMYEVEQLVQAASQHGLDIPYRLEMDLYEDRDDGW